MDIHIWNAVASTLCQVAQPPTWTDPSLSTGSPVYAKTEPEPIHPNLADEDDLINKEEPWDWQLPDLTPRGPWHTACVKHLYAATENLPKNHDQLHSEGLQGLEVHRANFELGELKRLQLLWWEFPPEHWTELHDGQSMNFLSTPTKGLTPNAPMMEDQVEIATKFVDELWHIGVFELVPEGSELLANAPLFTMPKPGQPGQ